MNWRITSPDCPVIMSSYPLSNLLLILIHFVLHFLHFLLFLHGLEHISYCFMYAFEHLDLYKQ
jgi:hypothetical protein